MLVWRPQEKSDSMEQQAKLLRKQKKMRCLFRRLPPTHESLQSVRPSEVAQFPGLPMHDQIADQKSVCLVLESRWKV